MNKHFYRLVWRHCRFDVIPAPETAAAAGAGASSPRRQRRQPACPRPLAVLTPTRLCLACFALLGSLVTPSAWATCSTTAGITTVCSGAANPLAPSFASTANGANVTVNSGASLGVLLGVGGTALSLTGNNVTLTNGGTIDPSLLGGIGLLASGVSIGNASAGGSVHTITNTGTMNGTVGVLGVSLPALTGLALTVQNAAGGVTNITNNSAIGAKPLLGVTLAGTGGAPVVAAYGGGIVTFTNTGAINGRVALQAGGGTTGNTFTNEGTVTGSVSLGAGGTNQFIAVTGSSVSDGGSAALPALPVIGQTFAFAQPGTVDGGTSGNNTLILRNDANDTTSVGTGTINGANYLNFAQAQVTGGTWTLHGPLAVQTMTLNGGTASFDDPGSFGSGALIVNGGALSAANAGVSLSLPVSLGANGLAVSGNNPLTLASLMTGTGGISMSGPGMLTLTAANTFSGGISLTGGTLIAGNAGAFGSGVIQAPGANGVLDATAALRLPNDLRLPAGGVLTLGGSAPLTLDGTLTGAGSLVKQGNETVTLTAPNSFGGGATIAAGTLALSGNGALQASGASPLSLTGTGAMFDMTQANGTRAIGSLNGVVGSTVQLGSNALTLGNGIGATFGGVISGTAGIVKVGAGTQTLTGANTYTGDTTINSGTIALGSGGSLASTGAVILAGNAGFDLSAAGSQTIGALQGVATSNVNLGGNTLLLGDTTDRVFGGTLQGTGNIAKQGSGTLTLSGQNTMTGSIFVNVGTLALGSGATLAGNDTFLGSSGKFDISNNGNLTIGKLVGAPRSQVSMGANALTFGDATNQTFAGTISGTGGIVKQGAGTQTLTGANTFSGSLTVNAGTLAVGAGGTLAGSNALTLGGPTATFDMSAAGDLSLGAVAGSGGTLALGANSLTFGDNADQTLAAAITGTGGLVKQGSGKQTLTGDNTFTGNVSVSAGTLAIGTGGSLAGGNTVTLADNTALDVSGTAQTTLREVTGSASTTLQLGSAQLTLGDSNAQTFDGAIHGTGGIVKTGTGTLTLGGNSDFSGGTTVDSGGLIVGSNTALGTGQVTFAGDATLDTAASVPPVSLDNDMTLGGNLTVGGTGDLTLLGSLSGAGGITKNGSATLTLDGTNTYTGATTIDAGTLALGNAASLNTSGTVNVNAGATLDLSAGNGTQRIGNVTGAGTVNTGVQTVDIGSNVDNTSDTVITGQATVVKTGTGTTTLTGRSSYTGGTVVAAGTLALAPTGGLPDFGAVSLRNAGSTLDLTAVDALRKIGALTGDVGTQVKLGEGSLNLHDDANHTFSGVISGDGNIIKDGAGTLTLTAPQTYTRGTYIMDGTVALAGNGSLASSPVTVDGAGATLDISGGGNQALDGLNVMNGGTVALGANTLTFGDANDRVIDGIVTGTGGIVKVGTSTKTLTGANTFTGGTTIENGTIALAGNGSLANQGTVNLANAGVTFDISQASGGSTIGALESAAGSTVQLGSNTLTFGDGGNHDVAGSIAGTGGIVKVGTGTQTLLGTQAFTGTATIADGTLALGSGGQLDPAATVNIAGDNATLDLSKGGNQTIGRLSGTGGKLALGGNTLSFGDSTSQTLGSAISGTGSLIKQGSGTQTLTGDGTFSGDIAIDGGTLALGDNEAVNANAVTMRDGTTLDLSALSSSLIGSLSGSSGARVSLGGSLTIGGINTLGNTTFAGTITDAGKRGNILVYGGGTMTLDGQNSYSGGTTVNASTLVLGPSGSLATGEALALYKGATFDASTSTAALTFDSLTGDADTQLTLGQQTLQVGDSEDHTFAGTLSGDGALVKVGSGKLTLSGANTQTGGTTLADGTLTLGSDGALGGGALKVTGAGTLGSNTAVTLSNDVAIDDGVTLSLAGSAPLTLDGPITGNGALAVGAGQVVTLGASNTYTGGTSVNGGTINAGAAGALGSGGLTLVNGHLNGTSAPLSLASLDGDATSAVTLNGGSLSVGTGSFAGDIGGNGILEKTGGGTLTLSGTNTLAGTATVAQGTLSAGSLGNASVNVQNGATFSTLPATTGASSPSQTGALSAASGGTIVVANPGSTLGVNGNLTLAPGATVVVAVSPDAAPSQINASGTADVNGANLVVNGVDGTYSPTTPASPVITAAGGVSGRLASTTSSLLYLTPTVSYTDTAVLLQLTRNDTALPVGASSPNGRAVATAISTLGAGNPLYDAALTLTSDAAPVAFESASGSMHASLAGMLMNGSQATRDAVSQRLRESLTLAEGNCSGRNRGNVEECLRRTGAGTGVGTGDETQDINDRDAGALVLQPRATMAWASAYGSRARQSAHDAASGGSGAQTLTRRGAGVLLGVDTPVGERWRVGVLGGIGHDTFDTGSSASGNSNDAQVGVYLGHRYGPLGLTLGGSYAWQQLSTKRSVALGPLVQTARASYSASTAQVFGEAAWRMPVGPALLEPFAGLAQAWVTTDAFRESGGVAALQGDANTHRTTFTTLGLRGEMPIGGSAVSGAAGRVRLSAGWRHAFGSDTPSTALRFVDTPASFTVAGVPLARDTAVVEAGVDAFVGRATTVGISYTGQFGRSVSNNTLFGNVMWRY